MVWVRDLEGINIRSGNGVRWWRLSLPRIAGLTRRSSDHAGTATAISPHHQISCRWFDSRVLGCRKTCIRYVSGCDLHADVRIDQIWKRLRCYSDSIPGRCAGVDRSLPLPAFMEGFRFVTSATTSVVSCPVGMPREVRAFVSLTSASRFQKTPPLCMAKDTGARYVMHSVCPMVETSISHPQRLP